MDSIGDTLRKVINMPWCDLSHASYYAVRLDGSCVFHLIGILEHYAIATTLRIQGDLTATSRCSSRYALHRLRTLGF